jgi:uroporphyrinogen-III decarboxylase
VSRGVRGRRPRSRPGSVVASRSGGGINTQEILPFADPDTVRADVRRMIDCLGEGGGYVLNSVHNLQNNVPVENIMAMFDEAQRHRRRAETAA